MINTERLTKTFFDLVQIDSPSGYEDEVCNFLGAKMNSIGLEYKSDSYGNLITYLKGKAHKSILLTAHVDTVEPGRGIKPRNKNGILKSSGDTILGADNKSGVAAILEAIESLSGPPQNSIEIVFTRSEEVGNHGAVNLDYDSIKSHIGFSFDSGGEIGNLTIASPYYMRFDLTLTGQATHAGTPEKGKNALTMFSSTLQNLKLGRVNENTLCNIGIISSGSARNTVPGQLTAKGEIRSYNEKDLYKTLETLQREFTENAAKSGGFCKIDYFVENPGFSFDASSPLVQFGENVLSECSVKAKLEKSLGCYDANIFFAHGISVLNISNGSRDNHTVKEYISVEDLVKTAQVVKKILETPYWFD